MRFGHGSLKSHCQEWIQVGLNLSCRAGLQLKCCVTVFWVKISRVVLVLLSFFVANTSFLFEIRESDRLCPFPEVLAQAGRRGCATRGFPGFVIHLNTGEKTVPAGYKHLLSIAAGQEGSCSKVRDSADGPQCWMKGWEGDTSIRSWAGIAGRGWDGAPRLPDGDTSARKGDTKVWGWE